MMPRMPGPRLDGCQWPKPFLVEPLLNLLQNGLVLPA
jgi:hypothetical protein